MWRMVLVILLMGGALCTNAISAKSTQDGEARRTDLAAIVLPPSDLPEPGFQLVGGGYLTVDDVRFLITNDYDLETEAVTKVFESASWQQGYTQALVLLEDRSYRTSTPLATVETTILAFEEEAGAELVAALLSGSTRESAESREPTVDGATTWRVVTSQDDRLVTVVRSERLVFEVVSADASGTPDSMKHAALVESTLERAQRVGESDAYGLSHQVVKLDDSRLVPIAIAPESPLVHDYYRRLDGQLIPVTAELFGASSGDVPSDAEQIVVSRQTAELASQSWLTAGVVVLAFNETGNAVDFADTGVYRDPLDIFALDETAHVVPAGEQLIRVEALSGDSRLGVPYTGYRLTVRDDAAVAQLVVRVIGDVRLDQRGVEQWAISQKACLAAGQCAPVALETLLATADPATLEAGAVEDGVYQSPVAPWSVTFDPDIWRVEEALAEGGYDYLYLRSERMDASFETIVDQQGDPEQCVLNELDRLREVEDRASIMVGSDDSGEAPGGLEPGHGWVIYTVEPLEPERSAEEYTVRIDCYTVVEGSISLVVQVRAPRDEWAEGSSRGDALRAGIEIDETLGHRSEPTAAWPTGTSGTGFQIPRRAVMGMIKPWTGNVAA